MYQLGLQASVSLLQSKSIESDEFVNQINSLFDSVDGKWVMDAVTSAMRLNEMSQIKERDVRIPRTLIETDFVLRLRSGVALSSLHCLAFMTRFNSIVEQAIGQIISGEFFFLFAPQSYRDTFIMFFKLNLYRLPLTTNQVLGKRNWGNAVAILVTFRLLIWI